MCDLLWADPEKDLVGWADNDRGVSFTFGVDIVRDFLHRNSLVMICRAHQVVQDGYEFFAEYNLITVFSAPAYGGEYDNDGAVMKVTPKGNREGTLDLECSLEIFPPKKSRAPVGGGGGSYSRLDRNY